MTFRFNSTYVLIAYNLGADSKCTHPEPGGKRMLVSIIKRFMPGTTGKKDEKKKAPTRKRYIVRG